ncbi:hypothetical protein [Rhodoferax sp. U11-2br]|uniref:hypothetical protein n=1 Tax=Rhodoferax sp. U11-2br TaxID=2838878 RepID=UPI001BE828E4|nr:hypothetical protein [Rhodoferax sp. U11-2br]MBT3067902.1 hypothetical protein [Rhodoferax sp. U11-2br]
MKTRRQYIPVTDIEPGMVLGETVQVVEHGLLSMVLPPGHLLTADNLNQLHAHHAEYICIDQPDERSDEQIALDTELAARRVQDIFRDCKLDDPTLLSLFDQVMAYRTA